MSADDNPLHPPAHTSTRSFEEAEARGKLVLLYQPEGLLGGTFT